jgi:hypothetical protein
MMTAVSFCMIIYFILLCLQLVPVLLSTSEGKNVRIAVHYMKKLVWILAAAGTFIAFFLQGSLGGGIWEDMWARPAWNRGFHEFFILAVAAAAPVPRLSGELVTLTEGKNMRRKKGRPANDPCGLARHIAGCSSFTSRCVVGDLIPHRCFRPG